MAKNFVPHICGNDEIYVPDKECTDCDKLERRVSILEECCEEVKGDLLNFYTKNETYNKDEVNNLINTINNWNIVEVNTLPSTGEPFTIYLVPKSPSQTSNAKDEYIYISSGWEKIGDTEIDLSNYYTKSQTDNLLNAKQNNLTAGANIQINGNTISATDTKYTPTKENIGSASDWSRGTLPTLGTAIPADDITAWNAGTPSTSSVSLGIYTVTDGTAPSLTYTAKSIPNVTNVGTLPSLSITDKEVVTDITAQ